jgi:membrane-associated phospholipid phosphatase
MRGDAGAASRHGPVAQLLIAWAPLSVILLAYAGAQWINAPLGDGRGAGTNRLGFGLHVAGPVQADRGVFGGVPSVWLQKQLVDGSAHWYDAAAALVYVTHFVSFPLVTGVVWFCLRDRFTAWIAAVLTLTTLGMAGYVVYPAAPPWLASNRGEIGTVHRISSIGWDYLHLDLVGRLTVASQQGSNPVAAMPSLHAGSALLVALFLWPLANTLGRAALLGYVMLMAVTLVYTGEHHVVDVVAGWLTAGVAVAVGAAVRPARGRGRTRGAIVPEHSDRSDVDASASAP